MVTNEILEYFIAEIKDAKIKQKIEEEIDDREVLFYYDGYLDALSYSYDKIKELIERGD